MSSHISRVTGVRFAICAALLLCNFPPKADATTLSVLGPNGASSFSEAPGSQFQVGIYADSYSDLYAWQLDLSWNPAVLSLNQITEGAALSLAGSTYFVAGNIDNTAGTATTNADTLLGAIPGATGANASLANFTFTALARGTSSLTIANVILLDSNLNTIPVTTASGTAVIGGTSMVTPEPQSFLLIGFGMALLSALRFRYKMKALYQRRGGKMLSSLLSMGLALCFNQGTMHGQQPCMTISNDIGTPGIFNVSVPGVFTDTNLSIPNNTSHTFDLSSTSVGGNYQVSFKATGGNSQFTISLNSDFVFSNGANQVSGYTAAIFNPATYSFSRIASQSCQGIIITTTSLPDAQPGNAYSQRLSAAGGVPPYTWSASLVSPQDPTLPKCPNSYASGLPCGFMFESSSGTLIGTGQNERSNLYSLSVQVTDSLQHTTQKTLSLLVNCSSDDRTDTDGDGLLDCWENYGVYVTSTNTQIDLPGMDSSPTRKDVFVYYDWLDDLNGTNLDPDPVTGLIFPPHTHDPQGFLQPVIDAFNNAPGGGITLHLIRGHAIPEVLNYLSVGDCIPPIDIPFNWSVALRHEPTYASNRSAVMHYAIFAHQLSASCTSTGIANLPGVNLITALGRRALLQGHSYGIAMAGTFMHELGHNLGLDHAGIIAGLLGNSATSSPNYKPNYLSVMNYSFQLQGLIETKGQRVDAAVDYARASARSSIIDLLEFGLDETQGIGQGAITNGITYGTRWWCYNDSVFAQANFTSNASASVDWNCNGNPNETVVAQVLRRDAQSDEDYQDLQAPLDDWSNLRFAESNGIGTLGVGGDANTTVLVAGSQSSELSLDDAVTLLNQAPVACAGDLNGDRVVDQKDLDFVRAHLGAKYGDSNYDPNADYNHDGVIDIQDLAAVSRQLGCKSQ